MARRWASRSGARTRPGLSRPSPHPGRSWQPAGRPATQSHAYVREGTTKILTLFHPATGQGRLRPVVSSTNEILHGWLRETLAEIVAELPAAADAIDPAATRAAWQVWQDGLAVRFTLPEPLPPLRLLRVWDTLAGHKTPEMVVWLCRRGIMPLDTPLGGRWLNMGESIQRILKRRALDGQQPQSPEEIGHWFEQTARCWNRKPTPFVWDGRRRQRRRQPGEERHRVGGSGARTHQPLHRIRLERESGENATSHAK